MFFTSSLLSSSESRSWIAGGRSLKMPSSDVFS
jgi:hypothetical protein